MDKTIWRVQMVFGWFCYWVFMILPARLSLGPFQDFLLPWAGFYAYDTGYEDHKWRRNLKALGEK